jgi:very-short-patch-repair endonuclease
MTTKEFIEKASKIWNGKFDYSKTNMENRVKNKIIVICPVHGEFECNYKNHLQHHDCRKCIWMKSKILQPKPLNIFIKQVKEIYGEEYDYSKVNYINNKTKIIIICKKHGEILVNPKRLLLGTGCKLCRISRGERSILTWLEKNNIRYNHNYRFEDCKNKNPLPFDFYLPDKNICIEFDGKQHYYPYFKHKNEDGMKNVLITQKHDKIKTKYCKQKGIKLIRIHYNKINSIQTILGKNI